jgi:hypothetical protein
MMLDRMILDWLTALERGQNKHATYLFVVAVNYYLYVEKGR